MRHTGLAAGLILWGLLAAGLAHAFEIEEQISYPGTPGGPVLRILSTADRAAFEPLILGFQADHAEITVDYTIAGTSQVMAAIHEEGAAFDLVISSAMDLQTKLANDGFARSYRSEATAALPDWARWRNQIFAFTQEPSVLVVSTRAFPDGVYPETREALIELLRAAPERFEGRVGTYDVRRSGFGYLMATQDARQSESFWRLTEVMGRLGARLYCCSSDMIDAVATGELALAYNVLGSYAATRADAGERFAIVALTDFSNVMLRTALIPRGAANADAAQEMVDFLAGLRARPDLVAASGLPPIDDGVLAANSALRPIEFGPGLLVFLDRLKRQRFIRSWEGSILQE